MQSSQPSTLLYFDSEPPTREFTDYFSQFNVIIKHHNHIQYLPEKSATLFAILINDHLIEDNQFQILETLFHKFFAPIILLQEHLNERKRILALEQGVDDCITKPIHIRELHARITAINRRIEKNVTQVVSKKRECISFHIWHLYPASRQIFNDQHQELKLSTSEYNLLTAFLKQPQTILSREFLLQVMGHESSDTPLDRRIDIQVSRLRHKIEPNSKKPLLLKTIRNVGYIFTGEVTTTNDE